MPRAPLVADPILVVDDDPLMCGAVRAHLARLGAEVEDVADGAAALERLRARDYSLVLLDLEMDGVSGQEVLAALDEGGIDVPVLVLTANATRDAAEQAERLGARAFLAKPINPTELRTKVAQWQREPLGQAELAHLRASTRASYGTLVGSSGPMRRVFDTLRRLERVPVPTVLISGPSGTGKNLVARAIHSEGPRADEPFMEIDCTALPEHLFESELFGHERGAFTDAKATKRGLLEVAGSGTLFLDEMGELPLATQAKLLRALEDRTFKRVGGLSNLPLRAAILAATNRSLVDDVAAGRFREDLYFRLNVIEIRMPSLAERPDDLKELANHLLLQLNRELGCAIEGISAEALEVMRLYPWPGNVRELRNVLERMAILGASGNIYASDLPLEIRFAEADADARPSAADGGSHGGSRFELPAEGVDLEWLERDLLGQALERTGGRKAAAAKLLGISRHALRYRMQKAGLEGAVDADEAGDAR